MSPETIFRIQLAGGYIASLICFHTFLLPRLRSKSLFESQRLIAILHSFRFEGLVFILPGIVGPNLPKGFAEFAAYGDFATGVLAMCALSSAKVRPLFWFFIVAYNLVGLTDIMIDYFHAIQSNVPAIAGQLGSAYPIVILYVPLLVISHVASLSWLLRAVTNHAKHKGLVPSAA